jgi:acetylornithine deacetylase/succinyl-diaminopimelate desuccinylase-like protein
MLVCATELRQEGNDEVGLMFVVGEEYDGRGALAAIDFLRQRQIKALINGEPTESKVASAQKGAVDFELRCTGRSAHSGYPELGIDANRLLLDVINDLYKYEWPTKEPFGTSTLNIGVLEGGVAANVIAEQARCRALLRSGIDPIQLKQDILSVIANRGEVSFSYDANPVEFFVPDGMKGEVFSYVSDAAFFNQLGIKILQFGPGSIHHAHTDHEYIEIQELESGVAVYKQLLQALIKS